MLRQFDNCIHELAGWFDKRHDIVFRNVIGIIIVACLPHCEQPMVETSDFGRKNSRFNEFESEWMADAAMCFRRITICDKLRRHGIVCGIVEAIGR